MGKRAIKKGLALIITVVMILSLLPAASLAAEITDMTFTLTEGLREGDANVAPGATVGTLAATGGDEPVTYALIAGDGTNDADNENFRIDGSNVKVAADVTLTEGTYAFYIQVTDNGGDTHEKACTITVNQADNNITDITFTPTAGLQEGDANVAPGATVGTLAATGGDAPITYTLADSGDEKDDDNDKFVIDGNAVKVAADVVFSAGTYAIYVQAADGDTDTYGKALTVTVATADSEITDIAFTPTASLQEGDANVAPGATVGTLAATGGDAPITYTLADSGDEKDDDNEKFIIDGSVVKVKADVTLTEGTYAFYIQATDNNGDTHEKACTVTVNPAAVTEPLGCFLDDLAFSTSMNGTEYINYNLSPEFDGAVSVYDLVIPDFEANPMNILYAQAPLSANAEDSCVVYALYNDAGGNSQEVSIGDGYTELHDCFSSTGRVGVITIEVRSDDGDVQQSYTVNVTYKCTISKLAVTDSNDNIRPLDHVVAYDTLSYAADVPDSVDSVTVSASSTLTSGIVLINGIQGKTLLLAQEDMQWDNNGEMAIPIVISYTGNETTTYTLTLERAEVDYIPEIISQPIGANYTQFDEAAPMIFEVQAPEAETGVLSYQWYLGERMPSANATKTVIDGAVSSSYIPPTDTVNNKAMGIFKGNRWYKCVVTYTVNGRAYQIESDVAAIHLDAVQIETPCFATQPADGEYLQGSTPKPLFVKASVSDNGPLNYQWYSNTADSNEGGTLIAGATEDAYTPPSNTAETLYYYCEVTNTIQSLSETAVSNTACITIVSLVDETGWQGAGTENAPYLLEDADDLIALRDLVNQGIPLDDVVLKMTDNITLPDSWTPIGQLKDDAPEMGEGKPWGENGRYIQPFSGVFDGGGYTVTVPEDGLPLFGYVRDVIIRDLGIYGTRIAGYGLINHYEVDYGPDGDYDTGAPKAALIKNVTIKSGTSTLYSGFIGGGASGANTIEIVNCTVEKDVIIGYDHNASSIGSFGGPFNGSVMGCVSYATVYGINNVGGLVGCKAQSMGGGGFKNSAFLGTIEATGNNVGGILGAGYDGGGSAPNTPVATVINCYVVADITGADRVGGILGSEPGCENCWDNGAGYLSDNHFYGTINADGSQVGAIVGFMKSFNKYQGISNNYYLDTCGVSTGIGYIEDIITTTHPKYAENGIDYEFDADLFCISATAEAFKNGDITGLLNSSDTSFKNWVQGDDYPIHSDAPVATKLELGGTYKTDYLIGDSFSTDGMVITATYSDSSTVTLDIKDVTFSGFDSSAKGVITINVKYLSAQTSYTIRVVSGQTGTIDVYFTLLGTAADGESGAVNTLRGGNLTTWIGRKAYTVSVDATVRDVFETALTAVGLTWSNPSGNYVQSITKGGVTLAEFTNGNLSGWMYTLNGKHSLLGIDEQFLNDGDAIVFHYTDDYTVEEGSEEWGGSGSSSGGAAAEQTLTPEATVSNGTASVSLSLSDIKDAVVSAKTNGGVIVVSPTVSGEVGTMKVALSADALNAVAGQTNADLSIQTPVGNITLPNAALDSIASQAGGSAITVSLGTVEMTELTENQQKAVGSDVVYDISVLGGSKHISSFDGESLTISLPYTLKDGEDAANVAVWYLNDAGELEQMTCTYNKSTGMATFSTTHLSYYVVNYTAIWTNPFTDVTTDDWFYEAVEFAASRDLFSGVTETAFEPDTAMTRSMLVTVLYRLEGRPSVTADGGFTDVQSGHWYTDAVIWSSENEIISGYGGGLFGTNDSITREQLATILYNYADYKGYDITATAGLTAYTDAGGISTWAESAMQWANAEGLVNGVTETTLEPGGGATRAQVATILMRFVENLVG